MFDLGKGISVYLERIYSTDLLAVLARGKGLWGMEAFGV